MSSRLGCSSLIEEVENLRLQPWNHVCFWLKDYVFKADTTRYCTSIFPKHSQHYKLRAFTLKATTTLYRSAVWSLAYLVV